MAWRSSTTFFSFKKDKWLFNARERKKEIPLGLSYSVLVVTQTEDDGDDELSLGRKIKSFNIFNKTFFLLLEILLLSPPSSTDDGRTLHALFPVSQ